jgi:hypothetical protein
VVRLVRAEFRKLHTTQVWFWMLLLGLTISVLVVVGSLAPADGVKTSADVPDIFATANGASLAVFVLGVLGVTTEFRYQTITPAVLATPARWRLVAAKLIAYLLVGIGYAAVCIGGQLATAVRWLAAKHIDYSLSDGWVRHVLLGLVAVFALFTVVGIGVGALIRNQIAAVVVGLIFLLVVQNVIAAVPGLKHAWPFTPAGAVTGLLFRGDGRKFGSVHALSSAPSLLVLVLWAVIPAALGAAYSMNRDIT